jgi:molecular chaperone GrpE
MKKSEKQEANPEEPVEPRDPASEAESKEKEKESREQLLRIKADFENAKKRLEKDKLDAIKFANERLLAEIFTIVDHFDRAILSLDEGHDPEKVKEGLHIAQSELHQVLEQHGVEPVKSTGTAFDPRFHEAVAVVSEAPPGTEEGAVVEEVQRGYLLNGRLIRPSRVKIFQHKQSDQQS